MSNKLSWSITMVAVVAMAMMNWMRDESPTQGEHVFRPLSSITSVNKPVEGRDRIEISHYQSFAPEQMVDISEYPIGEINI